MIQFQENAWTDRRMDGRKDKRTKGQTDPISKDPSGYQLGSNYEPTKKQLVKCNNWQQRTHSLALDL